MPSVHPLFFDAAAEYSVTQGRLPHWEQPGTVCVITFRTWDSMPAAVLDRFHATRNEWLRVYGIDAAQDGWERELARLAPHDRATFSRLCAERWEAALDGGHGSCPLGDPTAARVVADSLTCFDGSRYELFDFVVMPNHVHILASFPEVGAMRKQCESWKRYTATELNRRLARSGRFWQSEAFDHLVRTEAQFERLRDYLAENPSRAGLSAATTVHYSRDLPLSPAHNLHPKPLAERADHTQKDHT